MLRRATRQRVDQPSPLLPKCILSAASQHLPKRLRRGHTSKRTTIGIVSLSDSDLHGAAAAARQTTRLGPVARRRGGAVAGAAALRPNVTL
eukprot:CAMPEP_0177302048 /NCGR_PEP_ID=MMETSP0368-20130122/5380_1 /TAXON_ID=447022 ORGANISM="Scrippsiella hangoei-like, Strain SHHI-4" /NCGR_SAMPLE_ID=MMETSP0368 /ASSEMBLY_ACC=CAM_ASM_000363 /LENGTH=90 /DNA_ID=CAMNT_0018760479 /DNA_START=502 /DNA_END=774 /DNA_ORIENTATION=+